MRNTIGAAFSGLAMHSSYLLGIAQWLFSLVIVFPATAQQVERGIELTTPKLLVQPQTCVKAVGEQTCTMTISVRTLSPLTQPSCLWLAAPEREQIKLTCFVKHATIATQLPVVLHSDSQLKLTQENGDVIAITRLQVAQLIESKRRKRRGLGWNIL